MSFYHLKSDTRYLYHYTKSVTLAERILHSQTLRIGPIVATNDPRETKDWIFGLGARNGFGATTDDEFTSIEQESTSIAKNCCKVICFAQDAPGAGGMGVDGIYLRGFCKPRMWAQYADNHTGACLVFDRMKLAHAVRTSISTASTLFQGEVTYANRSRAPNLQTSPFVLDFDEIKRSGIERTVRSHIARFWRELFFEKLLDWRDEHEYRWVLWETDRTEHVFAYADALDAVLLGPGFPGHLHATISKYRRDLGFELASLNWKNGVPEVRPEV